MGFCKCFLQIISEKLTNVNHQIKTGNSDISAFSKESAEAQQCEGEATKKAGDLKREIENTECTFVF